MTIDFTSTTWEAARKSFILHLRAVRTRMTVYFYEVQLRTLTRWAEKNNIPLHSFGKRNLDAYLVHCSEDGKSQTTPITMSSAPLSSVFQSSAGLAPGCNHRFISSMIASNICFNPQPDSRPAATRCCRYSYKPLESFNPQPDSRPAATVVLGYLHGNSLFQSSAGLAPGCNIPHRVATRWIALCFNPQPDSRPAATEETLKSRHLG